MWVPTKQGGVVEGSIYRKHCTRRNLWHYGRASASTVMLPCRVLGSWRHKSKLKQIYFDLCHIFKLFLMPFCRDTIPQKSKVQQSKINYSFTLFCSKMNVNVKSSKKGDRKSKISVLFQRWHIIKYKLLLLHIMYSNVFFLFFSLTVYFTYGDKTALWSALCYKTKAWKMWQTWR